MEGFLSKLRTSLQRGRGVTVPSDPKALRHSLVSTIFANDVHTLEELLISSAFDVNTTFHRTRRTLLLCSIYASAYDCMSLLIKRGANINQPDVAGFTPFLAACRNGHRKCIKKLIGHPGVAVDQRDSTGLTGIHWLAAGGRYDCIQDCMPHLKTVDLKDEQGQTPLHIATKNGHIKVMEFLIEHGANISVASYSGTTALHYACGNGQLAGVSLLLSKGATNVPDHSGRFPIELAIESCHYNILIPFMEKFPQTLYNVVNLVTKDMDFDKLLNALNIILHHFPHKRAAIYDLLTEIASNSGLKLLTSYSIIDVEMFGLTRAVNLLNDLTKQSSKQEISSITQALSDVWSTMEAWFNLLHQKMEEPCNSCNGEVVLPVNKDGCTDSDSVAATTAAGKSELQVLCPRISCILQAYYSFCCIGHYSEETPEKFLQFVTVHEKGIEYLIKWNPSVIFENFGFLLSDSCLNIRLFKFVKLQSFCERKDWFYQHLNNHHGEVYSAGSMEEILISRVSLFTNSCHQLLRRDPTDLKKMLNIRFQDEDGIGPGVVKEWFDALSQELLNPDYALFVMSPDGCTFQPNHMSHVNPDHLNYFNFAGQIIGLALYHKHLINVYFTRSFYKHILGVPVNYKDVESIDPEYARNLQWILDNDISELGLDLTFTVENTMFGAHELVNLKPGGDKIPVTEENKKEYVQLVTELKMTSSIQPQIDSFLQGFHKFIPKKLTKIFDEYELEMLLSGLPDIDLVDWRTNTEYIGYVEADNIIQWFWQLLESMGHEERVQILQFTTGSSRVPFGGFENLKNSGESSQKFTINKSSSEKTLLPTASTCVNMLVLPEYKSKEELKRNLLIAMECSTGFGLA